MTSRKGIHIYIPKYFMAVRNCIALYIFVLYGLKERLCRPVRISTNCVTAGNINPWSYLF